MYFAVVGVNRKAATFPFPSPAIGVAFAVDNSDRPVVPQDFHQPILLASAG
jgi:hypothetical protein